MSPSARAGSCRRCLGNARKIWLWHSVALFYLLYCSKNIWPLLKRARLDAYITACSRNSTCWLAQFLQLKVFLSAQQPVPSHGVLQGRQSAAPELWDESSWEGFLMLSAGEQSRKPVKSLRSLHANQKPWLVSGGMNQALDWSMCITYTSHPYPSCSTSRRHPAPERWIQLTTCFQTAQIQSAQTFTCLGILYLQQSSCSWFLVYCISRNPQTTVRNFFSPFPQHSTCMGKEVLGYPRHCCLH